jgi:hypothetical protein
MIVFELPLVDLCDLVRKSTASGFGSSTYLSETGQIEILRFELDDELYSPGSNHTVTEEFPCEILC